MLQKIFKNISHMGSMRLSFDCIKGGAFKSSYCSFPKN
jgi:hypothetical protein